MKPQISVVINTLNEEKNLPYTLRSIQTWADEIVVVDMYSEDRTVEIARDFGAKVYFHERILAFDAARSFAIDQATGDWVLILDADELVPRPLSEELRRIAADGSADVVSIPRLNYISGAPLNYTTWSPRYDRHLRFFKKGFLNVSAKIHDFLKPVPEARIMHIPFRHGHVIVHFTYTDVSHFLEKVNRYTTIEAFQALERGEVPSLGYAMLRCVKEVVNNLIRRKGYRDGWRGLCQSTFMAFYRILEYFKMIELQTVGNKEAIYDVYSKEAESILAQYEEV